MKYFWWLGTLSFLSFAQPQFTNEQIDQVFKVLEKVGTEAAVQSVRALDADPESFGRYLDSIGENDQALEWFIAMIEISSGEEKANYYYWKGWFHFRRGEYRQAVADGELVLSVGPSERTEARVSYMLGMIYSDWEEYDIAQMYFQQSEDIYEKMNVPAGVSLSLTGLAEIAILERDFEYGKKLLKEADRYRLKSGNQIGIGRILELEATLAFMKADYPEFLKKAREAAKAYTGEGQQGQVLWMNIKIGLAKALTGEYGDAYDLALANSQIIRKQNNVKAFHYNNLTRILYRRCRGIDYSEMREKLVGWIETQRSSKGLTDLLSLVESVKCP